MKLIHDIFAVINIIGCVVGIFLMAEYYVKDVEFKKYETRWNVCAFCCLAFCFFGSIREFYSLMNMPLIGYSTWVFKFATSGIYIITFTVYRLIERYKKIDKQLNDNQS